MGFDESRVGEDGVVLIISGCRWSCMNHEWLKVGLYESGVVEGGVCMN